MFRKPTLTFVVSVCPPRLPLDRFSWNLIFEYFSKICQENSSFIKICQEYRVRYTKLYVHLQRLAESYLEWNTFQINVEKIKTHILHSVICFRKSCSLWDTVEKYDSRRDHRWQYNTAHGLCVLDNEGYRYTLRICNPYCFSTATIVARTRLGVLLYVYCLSCYSLGYCSSSQRLALVLLILYKLCNLSWDSRSSAK